jgi:hypothetical protein
MTWISGEARVKKRDEDEVNSAMSTVDGDACAAFRLHLHLQAY